MNEWMNARNDGDDSTVLPAAEPIIDRYYTFIQLAARITYDKHYLN